MIEEDPGAENIIAIDMRLTMRWLDVGTLNASDHSPTAQCHDHREYLTFGHGPLQAATLWKQLCTVPKDYQ